MLMQVPITCNKTLIEPRAQWWNPFYWNAFENWNTKRNIKFELWKKECIVDDYTVCSNRALNQQCHASLPSPLWVGLCLWAGLSPWAGPSPWEVPALSLRACHRHHCPWVDGCAWQPSWPGNRFPWPHSVPWEGFWPAWGRNKRTV